MAVGPVCVLKVSTLVWSSPFFSPALPYATVLPDNVAVRVGEVIRLQCLAHGTPPLTYTWTRLHGRLPSRAVVNGGDLQINLAAPDDAGSYKCAASNGVGSSDVVAKVTVRCEFAPEISSTSVYFYLFVFITLD